MAKIDKWGKLRVELTKSRDNLWECSNPTAEECGALWAYGAVLRLMTELEASEKKV